VAADRTASTVWEGGLADGKGSTSFESSGIGTFDVSWPARTEESNGKTSPEELVAAAHASCYSMALAGDIGRAGGTPKLLETSATVTFDKTDGGWAVTKVALKVRGTVEGMEASEFGKVAHAAKDGCPISKLIAGNAELTLDAALA
jgi:osmotically inducible protein OsmC